MLIYSFYDTFNTFFNSSVYIPWNDRMWVEEVKTFCPEGLKKITGLLVKCRDKVKSLRLTNQALLHEGVWGSGYIDPHFLDLGTSWR
jgi:hypothetical protein